MSRLLLSLRSLFSRKTVTPTPAPPASNVVSLADLDPKYAKLIAKRRGYTHPQSKGARKVEAELSARVHEHLARGRT